MKDIEIGRNEWKYYLRGPLNAVAEGVKCNYIIYWSGDHGMELVDKWTTKGKAMMETKSNKIHTGTQFENYIRPPDKSINCSSGT